MENIMKILLTSDTHYGHTVNRTARLLNKFVKKIGAEKPDIVLHAGDWGSTKQKEVESCLKLFRRELGEETPIVGTLGNHDAWTNSSKEHYATLKEVEHNLQELFAEYHILDGYKLSDNIEIFSYNSWYKGNNPPSNDHKFIPPLRVLTFEAKWFGDYIRDMHQYLIEKSYVNCFEVCGKIATSKAKHKIVVTHFEPVGNYRDDPFYDGMKGSIAEHEQLIEAGATILCYGHSHRVGDYTNDKGVRIVNCGSDYNFPEYKIIELE
jgi:predicted phosphodiesterase